MKEITIQCPRCGQRFTKRLLFDMADDWRDMRPEACPSCGAKLKRFGDKWKFQVRMTCTKEWCGNVRYVYMTCEKDLAEKNPLEPDKRVCPKCGAGAEHCLVEPKFLKARIRTGVTE